MTCEAVMVRRTAFARAMIRWRQEREMTQGEFAEALGVTYSAIGHWEIRKPPSCDLLLGLEFMLAPPVPYRVFWPVAKAEIQPQTLARYTKLRALVKAAIRKAKLEK